MKAFSTTIIMAIIAAISCGVAFYYYPRVQSQNATSRVDQPLFEESYANDDVRTIKITSFDKQQNAIKKFELSQVGGSWVIPNKNNFLASNAKRVAAAVSSLQDSIILQEESDEQKDYEQYGVVEPDQQMGASGVGVGTMISLEDRNRQTIRDLIVGFPTRDQKRFVRVPGQPQIYVIDFDASVLETDFHSWVDGDLLRLMAAQIPINWVEVNYYSVDPQSLATNYQKKQFYKVQVKTDQQAPTVSVWLPDDNQKLMDEPTTASAQGNPQTMTSLIRQLALFEIQDVKPQNQVVAGHLANPKESDPAASFRSLVQDGFRRVGFENGQHQFDSVGGKIRVAFQDGTVFSIYIGNFAGIDISDQSKINRFMMVTAEVDESLVPEPKKPTTVTDATDKGSEEATSGASGKESTDKQAGAESTADNTVASGAQQDDDAKFQYQQNLNLRKQLLQKARQRANAFNQLHADWIYVITEDTVGTLFPDSNAWVAAGQSSN